MVEPVIRDDLPAATGMVLRTARQCWPEQ